MPQFQSRWKVQSGKADPFRLVINRVAMHAKFGTNRGNRLQSQSNDLSSSRFVGCCSPWIVLVAFVDMSSLPGWITIPIHRSSSTVRRWNRCFSSDLRMMTTLSWYLGSNYHGGWQNIVHWAVESACRVIQTKKLLKLCTVRGVMWMYSCFWPSIQLDSSIHKTDF